MKRGERDLYLCELSIDEAIQELTRIKNELSNDLVGVHDDRIRLSYCDEYAQLYIQFDFEDVK